MSTVGVLGLGLIGGSLARALHARTDWDVLGLDADPAVVARALSDGVIRAGAHDGEQMAALAGACDVLLVALYPGVAVERMRQLAPALRPGTLVWTAAA